MKKVILLSLILLAGLGSLKAQKTKVDSIKMSCDSLLGSWEVGKIEYIMSGKVIDVKKGFGDVVIITAERRLLQYSVIMKPYRGNLLRSTVDVTAARDFFNGTGISLEKIGDDNFSVKTQKDGKDCLLTYYKTKS